MNKLMVFEKGYWKYEDEIKHVLDGDVRVTDIIAALEEMVKETPGLFFRLDWDDDTGMSFFTKREESDYELEARTMRAFNVKKSIEDQERAELARLKVKYGE